MPKTKPRRARYGLSLYEFADDEFLIIVEENGSEPDEWVTTREIAIAIFGEDSPDVNRCVGSRLAWMHRFGAVERDKTNKLWRLSEMGKLLIHAKLKTADEDRLAKLSETEMWEVSQILADRFVDAGETAAILMRRAIMRGFHYRKRGR